MKLPVLSLTLLVLMAGCASTESTKNSSQAELVTEVNTERPGDSVSDDKHTFQNLGDYLQRIPGVQVNGQTVIIRGINSFQSGLEPLFVLDGQVIGSNYVQANSMVNVREIDYVKVLKGSDAAIYGVRGGNGVVLIERKK